MLASVATTTPRSPPTTTPLPSSPIAPVPSLLIAPGSRPMAWPPSRRSTMPAWRCATQPCPYSSATAPALNDDAWPPPSLISEVRSGPPCRDRRFENTHGYDEHIGFGHPRE